jgi:hypothetical protein
MEQHPFPRHRGRQRRGNSAAAKSDPEPPGELMRFPIDECLHTSLGGER